jgi:hypothetical protein
MNEKETVHQISLLTPNFKKCGFVEQIPLLFL